MSDIKWTGVHSLINRYREPFDRDGLAEKISKEQGVSKKELIDDWEAKAERSRKSGIDLHGAIEKYIHGIGCPIRPALAADLEAMKRAYKELCDTVAPPEEYITRVEQKLEDTTLRVRGIADLLFLPKSQDNKEFIIADWKIGAKKEDSDAVLHMPFSDIPDTQDSIACLQMAMYGHMVKRAPDDDLIPKAYYIIRIGGGQYNIYEPCKDIRNRIEDAAWKMMLMNYNLFGDDMTPMYMGVVKDLP